jgi:hypothetical protein
MQQGNAVPETSAKAAWKSAEPWGITDWSRTANALTLVLKNNSSETMSFTDIYVNTTDANTGSTQNNVASGATVTRTITMAASTCSAGSKYALPKAGIYIDYNTTNIASKKQYAVADIVGTC